MSRKEDNKSSVGCIKILVNTFNSHLMDIGPETPKQHKAVKRAIDAMAKFEYGILPKLEKAFE
jgi:hypothetical protein